MAVQCVIALIAYWIWHAIVAVVENNCSLRLGVCYCGSTNVPLKCKFLEGIDVVLSKTSCALCTVRTTSKQCTNLRFTGEKAWNSIDQQTKQLT